MSRDEQAADEHVDTVGVLLREAGLEAVPEDEQRRLAQLYPGLRRSVDKFYEVETGDGVTAAVFRAEER